MWVLQDVTQLLCPVFKARGRVGDSQHDKLPQVGESCSEAKIVGYGKDDTL